MKKYLTILFCVGAVLVNGRVYAFEIPKECEQQACYYLNSYKGAFETSNDTTEIVTLGSPFKIGGAGLIDLIELENGTELLDIPKNWSYCWPIFLNNEYHTMIQVSGNCEKAYQSPIYHYFYRHVLELLEHHPEFLEDDIYVLSLPDDHGPRHVLLIIDIGDRMLVTSSDPETMKILGLKKLYKANYSFRSYDEVLPYLLKAAKEEYEEEQYNK